MDHRGGGIFSKRPQTDSYLKIPSSRKITSRINVEAKKTRNQVSDGNRSSIIGAASGVVDSNGNAGSESTVSAINVAGDSGDKRKKPSYTKRSNTSLGLKTALATPRSSIVSNITSIESLNTARSTATSNMKSEINLVPKKPSKTNLIRQKVKIAPEVEEIATHTPQINMENEEETCEDPADDILLESKDLSSVEESICSKSPRLKLKRSSFHLEVDSPNDHSSTDKGKMKISDKAEKEKISPRSPRIKNSPRKVEEKLKIKKSKLLKKEVSKTNFSDPEKQSSNKVNDDDQSVECGLSKSTKLSNKSFYSKYEKVAGEAGDAGNQIKCLEALQLIEEKIDDDIKNIDNSDGRGMQGPLIDLNENYVKILDTLEQEKSELVLCIDVLNSKLQEAEQKINKLEPRKNDNVKEYKKKLVEHQNLLKEKEKEIQRIKNINKSLEEHKKGVDMKNEILLRELSQCELRIDTYRNENDNLKKSIMQLQNKTNLDAEDEFRILYENERVQCEKLRNMVTENLQQMDNLKFELEHLKDSNSKIDQELANELDNLKLKYEKVLLEKEVLECEKRKLEVQKPPHPDEKLGKIISVLQSELDEVKQRNEVLSDMLEKAESKTNGKNVSEEELDELTIKYKTEIDVLQSTLINLKHENEHLNAEIFKHKIEAKQMQETNFMNQRLLRIRGELIKYFHENKEKCSIHDIYPGLTKSGRVIDQDIYVQNSQIPIRINELQKLSSSLDNRDADLSKKNHVIKLLEDNEGRNKQALIKLEDQNTRLELEVSELRRLLRMNSQASYL